MASTSLNIVDYRGYISGGYTTGENAGAGNGNFAGTGSYYSITQVSWGSVSAAASSMGTLTFTTTLRKNSEATVNATAYLSSQGFSGSWDSSKVIAQQTQSVSFNDWNTTSVTFTFNIGSRSTNGETLYIWLGGGPLYHHFNSSSGSVSYNLKTYTISYNANGYGSAPAAQTKTHNSSLTLQPFIANQSITGYKVSFNSNGSNATAPTALTSVLTKTQTYWNTNSNGTGTNYGSRGSYTANAAATLYAIWNTINGIITLPAAITRANSVTNYSISYNANGGDSTPNSQTLARSTPYTFGGWNTNSAGTGTNYNANSSYTPSAATTLYAKWNTGTQTGSISLAAAINKKDTYATGYTVTFNANGGNCDTSSLTVTDTVKWTFNKWNTKSDGTGTAYGAGVLYSTNANLALYATWNSTINKGAITLPIPTRAGYKFAGWATSATATSGSMGSYTPAGNITLYATWVADGTIRIWYDGQYRMALVYVYDSNNWKITLPYMYDNSQSEWHILGG